MVRSLSTNAVASARMRADLLYRHSEGLFAAAASMLSSDEISRLVKDFYQLTLTIDDHRRLFPDQPWSEEDHRARSDYLDQTLVEQRDALRKNDFEKANPATQVVMARSNVAEGDLRPGEYNQIRQAILRASIDIISELRARQDGDFNHDPRDRLLKDALSGPTDASERLSKASALSVVAPSPPPPSGGPNFSEIAEAFRSDQVVTKIWDQQTAGQARATYRLFVEICGDRPLNAFTRADADEFRKKVQRLPWDYSKAPAYRGRTVEEILTVAAAQARTREVQLITQRTVKRHFSALSGLWQSALSAGAVGQNIFSGFRFGSTKRASEQRDAWTLPELKVLFQSPIYTGCKSELRRADPGSLILKDEKYWLPLIALFSGMRQEEIAQLHVEDVKVADGITFFDINDRPPRMLKNANAARQVPLHSTLIKIGFLDYVEHCRKGRQTRLFPNLKPGGADSRLGHSFSKWFTRYRRDIGVYRKGLDFHSFRHTASTLMHQAGVERAVLDHVTGHSTPGETSRYVKASALAQLQLAIDTIDIGFDLPGLLEAGPNVKAFVRPQLKYRKQRRRPPKNHEAG
ncbi:site-specific integrase [Mesorhizobium sp. M4B.F.Ca.ET.214.01.1.1]|nr:site-specific integrase [Mesorhizobium sp. M4B.F.Ca.ET.214.01.1.1]TGQ62581.1 site-specific integrase [Mesorhizobium sp. M4B.F.Ca.ET.211.01.1.1]TGU39785.1 site-specific integrase [Mesorhizobium sp. M4B.F.Ca.ET.150.01.1.1]